MQLAIFLALIGTPGVAVGLAWRLWFRHRSQQVSPRGQAVISFLGLVAASANVLIYYSWFTYRLIAGSTQEVWKLQHVLSNASVYLVVIALAGALFGRDDARSPLGYAALLGGMLWLPYGVL